MTHAIVPYWKVLGWTEDFWGQFCEQQRLVFEGAVPSMGLVKTSKEWNVTVVELQHLLLESGMVIDESERRTKLSDRMLSVSEMAVDLAIDKMQSDEEAGELKIRDAGMLAKAMSDASLNLKNGSAAPTIQNISIGEIKQVIALNRSMPETFIPITPRETIQEAEVISEESR